MNDIDELFEVFEELYAHLQFCGWGDSWERKCVAESKLRERAEALIEKHQKPLGKIADPELTCDCCKKSFGTKSGLRSHKKHSMKCKMKREITAASAGIRNNPILLSD